MPVPKSLPDYTPDALEDHIYLDCMAFGMGSSCLQVTFQACSIEQARRLYDQLTPITPLMLALSASSPVYRAYLSDVDCRWKVIAGSVDDRTREERGLEVALLTSPEPLLVSACTSLATILYRDISHRVRIILAGATT
jgi:hypothetical protein